MSSTFGSSRVGCKIADVAGLSRPLLDTRFRAYIARLLAICNQNLKVNKQATDWFFNIFAHFTVLLVLFKLIVYINKTNGWLNYKLRFAYNILCFLFENPTKCDEEISCVPIWTADCKTQFKGATTPSVSVVYLHTRVVFKVRAVF